MATPLRIGYFHGCDNDSINLDNFREYSLLDTFRTPSHRRTVSGYDRLQIRDVCRVNVDRTRPTDVIRRVFPSDDVITSLKVDGLRIRIIRRGEQVLETPKVLGEVIEEHDLLAHERICRQSIKLDEEELLGGG